jgi:hypothetical protein
MDLPDVDWFCKDCWLLDDQGHIPLVYTKVIGNKGDHNKVGHLSVGWGAALKEKVVESLGKLGIVRRSTDRGLNVHHETGKLGDGKDEHGVSPVLNGPGVFVNLGETQKEPVSGIDTKQFLNSLPQGSLEKGF